MTKEKEKRRDDHMLQSEIEDVQLGASIVISNDEVSGVFMSDGKIEQIDYEYDETHHSDVCHDVDNIQKEKDIKNDLYGTEKYVCISDEQ